MTEYHALQWTGMNLCAVAEVAGKTLEYTIYDVAWKLGIYTPGVYMLIHTPKGAQEVHIDDYVVEIKGDGVYVFSPEEFDKLQQTCN